MALLLAAAIAAWSATETPAGDTGHLIDRGLPSGYSLDHEEAFAAFSEATTIAPSSPAAFRLTAATAWIGLLFEQGAITVDDYLGQATATLPRAPAAGPLVLAFRQAIDRALALSEAELRRRPAEADAHYQAGAAYGCLASYTATVEGRVLGSLGAARRAYREHARVLALDPSRRDAGLTVGTYQYVVANLSAPLRLMAHIAGFGGNREEAIRLVEDAARYSGDAQPNARFTLILIYNRERRFDAAMQTIHELQRQYPRNRLLWLEEGNTALRAGRPGEARTALDAGLAKFAQDSRPKASGEEARWRYALATALVDLRDSAAESELQRALAVATRDWIRGRAHKDLGRLADLAGSRSRAIEEYRVADRLCRADRDTDCVDAITSLMKTPYR
jgi:tetratricopeptide (TPR) repeat protein